MADPKRLKAAMALTDHLEQTVTIANSYQHDLANAVFRGRMVLGAGDPVPAVTMLEAIDLERALSEAGEGLMQADDWPVFLQGFAEEDRKNPTDPAHRLMADVKKALARLLIEEDKIAGVPTKNSSYMLGGIVEGFRVGPGTVRPPDETSAYSYFYLPVVMRVAERLDDPYDVQ